LTTLTEFAKTKLGIDDFQPWDVTFTSENLKSKTLSLSQELLRPYFPVESALKACLKLLKLFGIRVRLLKGVPVGIPDVRFFSRGQWKKSSVNSIWNLYARPRTNAGGAWMNSAIVVVHPQGFAETSRLSCL